MNASTFEAEELAGRLHVERQGPPDGPVLLLLHGGGVAGWMWRPVREALAQTHLLIVPDLPGHGRSAQVPFTRYAEIADALLALLQPYEGRPRAAVGFSMGAQLVVSLLGRAPRALDAAVVVSALLEPIRWEPSWALPLYGAMLPLTRFKPLMRAAARSSFPPELLEDVLAEQGRMTARTMTAFLRENRACRLPGNLSESTTRVLAVAGAREPAMVARSAKALADAVPLGEARVLGGVSHDWPLLHREAFVETVRDWLGQAPGAGGRA